jgi:hypothetical protein
MGNIRRWNRRLWLRWVVANGAGEFVGLGVILAIPQWLVLRRLVAHGRIWVPANAAAWAAGMPVIFLGVGMAFDAESLAFAVMIAAASLLAAGLIVGGIHGVALIRLAASEHEQYAGGRTIQER